MNFSDLFNHLDSITEKNKKYYEDIHSVLYFNNEDYLENPNFLNENNQKTDFFSIKLKNLHNQLDNKTNNHDDFGKFSQDILKIFDIDNFNISNGFKSITECILKVINYNNINGKKDLFEKMLRDFDAIKLFKKFKFQKRKICKKNEIRNLLLEHNDNNNIIKYFLSNYLSVNIIILENNNYKFFSEDDIFEPFKTTILIYKYDNKYHFLSDKIENKKLFTSDDKFTMKLYNILDNDSDDESVLEIDNMISNFSLECNTIENNIPIVNNDINVNNDIDYSKMKLNDLKKICKEKGIKGYSKLKKNKIIDLLNTC